LYNNEIQRKNHSEIIGIYLAQNKVNNFSETHTTHRVLIGTPLILALLFSFGFILMHPANPDQARPTAAGRPVQSSSGPTTEVPADLPSIPLAATSLPTLDQATPASDPSSAATAAESHTATASPQTARNASPATASSLQSAVSNSRSLSPNQPISTKVNLPTSILTNLLH
jgi:hypothetical protein